jgi:hypothetical protein
MGTDGAPAADALCLLVFRDPSPELKAAALDAIEKVRPDLFKPVSSLTFKAALKEGFDLPHIIPIIGEYGDAAKELLPLLKKQKLSPDEVIRVAAGKAIDKIENP